MKHARRTPDVTAQFATARRTIDRDAPYRLCQEPGSKVLLAIIP